MGLFNRRKENLYDYLDREVDKAEIKAVCSNELNEIHYMKLALQIVSSYIASAISTCEFKLYDKDGPVKNETYYKLNIAPSPNVTATQFKYKLVKQLISNGNSLVVQHRNNLFNADSFGFDSDSINGYVFDNVVVENETLQRKFTRRTSFYFKLEDEKVKYILDNIEVKTNQILSYALKTYKRAINNKWKLRIDSAKQHDPKFQEEYKTYVEGQLKEFIDGDSGVYPELNGYSLEHLDDGTTDRTDSSDLRNLRKDIFDMVAETFKMPPSMMYGNISNLKEVINQFITFAVKPYASLIGEEITRNLFSMSEILDENKRCVVDTSTINYRDIFDVAEGIDKLISDGVANIDDVRPLVNLPLLNTDYSKQHWITKNYSKIEDVMNGQIDNSNDNFNTNNIDIDSLKGGDGDEE